MQKTAACRQRYDWIEFYYQSTHMMVMDPVSWDDITNWSHIKCKKMGPRTDPGGTPEIHGVQPERCWPSLTYCFRFNGYDSIQSKTAPAIPKSHYWRRRSSMEWFIVSNAADISRAMTAVIFLSSIAVYMLSNTCSSAVSVEWPAR